MIVGGGTLLKKLKAGDKYGHFGYIFTAPFFITLLIFNIYPMMFTVVMSFFKWDGSTAAAEFIGFANFAELFKDGLFYQTIANTFFIYFFNVVPQMVFAVVIAAILADNFSTIKGKGFFRAVYYLPNLVTMASVGVLFYYIMDWQTGSLNKILVGLNVLTENVNWLQDPTATRFTISFIQFWMWFGYSMIIFMSGIKAIPDDIYEAARVDGANRWQTFWRITLPSIKGSIIYNIVTSVIGGLAMFDVPYVITGGSGAPMDKAYTMVNYMYNMMVKNYNYGYGATIYVGMFLVILVFAGLAFKLLDKNMGKV
jgi:multiple sugar transport system permease protein